MATATKKAASKIADSSAEKATKASDNTTSKKGVVKLTPDGRIDQTTVPKGITVTRVDSEYLVSHDGINDDGTVSAGWACRTSVLDDISAIIQHRGHLPE